MVELTEISLCFGNLPEQLEGMCIAHISDLHVRGYGTNERILHRVMREPCDMLICTGDMCYQFRMGNPLLDTKRAQEPHQPGLTWQQWVWRPHVEEAIAACHQLFADDFSCPLGVYFVQGNHDPDEFIEGLSDLNITILANETRQIELGNGQCFNLAGVCGHGRLMADIPRTLLGVDPGLFTIAACHYPEMAEPLGAAGVDLVLAGHTHGGQICRPDGRAILTHSCTGGKYASGLNHIGNTVVSTSRGLGCSFIPIRIFCPAEITRLTLHRADAGATTIKRTSL